MATATCLNQDCEKENWELTKHPSQYSRGVTCPECGTSRVDVETAEQGAQQGAQPTQQQSEPAPAPAPQQGHQGGQQGAAAPDVPSNHEAMDTAETLAEFVGGMSSDDPAERETAKARALKTGALGLARVFDQREKQAQQRNERAKQTTDDEIRVSKEYPTCPDCGGQLTQIPDSGEFPCPHCSVLLEV